MCATIRIDPPSPATVKPSSAEVACEIQFVDEERVRRVQSQMKPRDAAAELAEVFKVLGDTSRIMIVWALSREELCVCDLARLLDMSPSAVSHSLRSLRQLRLVKFRKEGKIVYYSLSDDRAGRLLAEGFRQLPRGEWMKSSLHRERS